VSSKPGAVQADARETRIGCVEPQHRQLIAGTYPLRGPGSGEPCGGVEDDLGQEGRAGTEATRPMKNTCPPTSTSASAGPSE
jgi:hypothetical protein